MLIMSKVSQLERDVVQALRAQAPLGDLPGVRIRDVKEQPPNGFDVEFQLESGNRTIPAFGEIKTIVSPKILEEIAPWMGRMRAFRNDAAFLLICPFLPPRSQTYCMQNQIDFLDLAGNVSINIPGTFTLQRLGMRGESSPGVSNPLPATNVFSGRSSRVLRVLLERIKPWTLTEIANELQVETNRFAQEFSTQKVLFTVSFSAISKALASLEEQLWIRRQNSAVTVPEPRRLLLELGEKYKERYRWRLRSSFETLNPFGPTPAQINNGLESLLPTPYAFTSAAAAADAPFIDIDRADVFLVPGTNDAKLRELEQPTANGGTPKLRFIYPYDEGVFLYAQRGPFPRVSNIQAYLDLYARGGRDYKQAEHLLNAAIAARWKLT
jgi:hypothetical protein